MNCCVKSANTPESTAVAILGARVTDRLTKEVDHGVRDLASSDVEGLRPLCIHLVFFSSRGRRGSIMAIRLLVIIDICIQLDQKHVCSFACIRVFRSALWGSIATAEWVGWVAGVMGQNKGIPEYAVPYFKNLFLDAGGQHVDEITEGQKGHGVQGSMRIKLVAEIV